MSSVQYLRQFVTERLTAAAEEILGVFGKTIVEYEEEIDRQRRLLDIVWKPQIKLQRIEIPQQHVCTKEEVLTDQQLCNQETNSSVDQEDPEPPHIKEEREVLCSIQEGEQLVLTQEMDTFKLTPTTTYYSNNVDGSPMSETVKEQIDCQHRLLDIVWNPRIKLHRIGQNLCMAEEVLTDQQFCNNEGNSRLDQEEPQPPKIKEEQEQLCRNLEGEQLLMKLETDTIMLTPTDEESDHSQPQPNNNHQLLSHSSPVADSQDHKESQASLGLSKLKKRHHRSNVDNSSMSDVHLNTQTCKMSFKCDTCGKAFRYKSQLNRHLRIHAGKKKEHKLKRHLPNHTGEKPYVCTSCGKQFKQKALLTDHFKVHTDEAEICSTCGKRFSRKASLIEHVRLHTGERPCICKTCGKGFRTSSGLFIHSRIHTGERPYICNTCGKDFISRSALVVHMRIHTGERPYLCKTCGKRFNDCSNYKTHMRSHIGEKPYACKTCGKTFVSKSGLSTHMKIHTGEKPHVCNTCGKRFLLKSTLHIHLRRHTGEKPYLCNTCGRRFTNKDTFKYHIRVHTGERPFPCQTCNKSFRCMQSLTNHMRIHTGEKPYVCHTCGKRFSLSSTLRTHLKTHTR
ncbi:zinc finger protein 260-like [Channa argus]|uniref:zinc finger protein 260-like n=1 Tax=Channa argus TaxID=215402 RepID=UPI002946D2E0|nr:hypothetical protein Q8A73_015588 [Channa argus]